MAPEITIARAKAISPRSPVSHCTKSQTTRKMPNRNPVYSNRELTLQRYGVTGTRIAITLEEC